MEKWRNLKQQEMFQKEAKFKQRQKNELVALQKRIQSGREEQKKQRQMDLERWGSTLKCCFQPRLILRYRLLQRYQNVKAELQQQQNLERIRAEKLSQRGTGRIMRSRA